jgi:hypothetical protein
MNNETEKSAEQIASEINLDIAIKEDAAEQSEASQQGAQNEAGENAQNALAGLLSIIPMGLDVVGLKNTASVWSSGVVGGVSAALMPVLRKYSYGQRFLAYLESGGGVEEFALLIALTPVTLATIEAYKLDTKKVEKEVKSEEVAAGGKQSAESPLGSTFEFKEES